MTVLFFVTDKDKFVLLSNDSKIEDTLTLKNTYFIKNVVKKDVPSSASVSVYETITDTQLKPLKRPLSDVVR